MPKIKCPGCGGVFYETTRKYKSNVRPNGSFVRLLDPWKTWGWNPFDGAENTVATTCSQMNCTSCGSPLAPNGRLTIAVEEFPCPECGKICKSAAGLRGHMITHGKKFAKKEDVDAKSDSHMIEKDENDDTREMEPA